MKKLEELFTNWNAPMVRACLQGYMGRVITWGEDSALAAIGDFCFLAGKPASELVECADAPILVPCGEGWGEQIKAVLGKRAVPFTRYAVRYGPENFDQSRLFSFTETVPKGFSIQAVDKEIYFTLLKQEWSRDLCGCFADASDFAERGLGFVVTDQGLPVAGAASYAVCDRAIEIEIDTCPDYRRRGLAAACGAKLILECQKRKLIPGWDAHNRGSLALAEKLGYRLDRPYIAYWVEEKARDRGISISGNAQTGT